jgi:hypothetical protein
MVGARPVFQPDRNPGEALRDAPGIKEEGRGALGSGEAHPGPLPLAEADLLNTTRSPVSKVPLAFSSTKTR